MAIERKGDTNSPLSHQNETQGVDRRELVQVGTFEIFPGVFQVPWRAGQHSKPGNDLERILLDGQLVALLDLSSVVTASDLERVDAAILAMQPSREPTPAAPRGQDQADEDRA